MTWKSWTVTGHCTPQTFYKEGEAEAFIEAMGGGSFVISQDESSIPFTAELMADVAAIMEAEDRLQKESRK